jgi:hypothetical protein
MFKKCMINQVLKEGLSKGKTSEVCRRYLSMFYGIKLSKKAIKKRVMSLRLTTFTNNLKNISPWMKL